MEEKLMKVNTSISIMLRRKARLRFLAVAASAIAAGYMLTLFSFRVDLTEDRRYTLSPQTKTILSELPGEVYIQVYLDGDMPVPFKKMRRSVSEMLDEFMIRSDRKIGYDFINPSAGSDKGQRNARMTELINKGLTPVNVQAGDDEGGTTTKMIFPGMIVNFNGTEVPVNFLKNNPSLPGEQNILHSIEGLEYEMIQTISTLTADTIYKIAFIEGHGELDEYQVADITLSLAKYFTVDRGIIGGRPGILDSYSAIIIAKPEESFSESDKFVIDQYIMNGGRVLWLAEKVFVNADSLLSGETMAMYRPLGLGDQLFRYGARINPVTVQDMECVIIPMRVLGPNDQSQIVPAPWPYYPLLVPGNDHPITRNLNRVRGEFVNSVDTVGLDPAVRKSILLTTTQYSRIITPPVLISLAEAGIRIPATEYNRGQIPVAMLLEGVFQSVFKNRMIPELTGSMKIRTSSDPTRMIVVADGDIIRNDVSYSGGNPVPLPLGKDRYTEQIFGNRDFLINCMNYLVDDNGLLELRSRELRLRLIDKALVRKNLTLIRLVNLLLPVLIVALAGFIYTAMRVRRFTTR
jgi:ABC-2 type transport system permease protein